MTVRGYDVEIFTGDQIFLMLGQHNALSGPCWPTAGVAHEVATGLLQTAVAARVRYGWVIRVVPVYHPEIPVVAPVGGQSVTLGLQTLRGSGPAPAGYYRCYGRTCPARRSPFTGRFSKSGTHYHPKTGQEV